MRLAIFTIGSLGDLQPHIALGLALKDAGHEVCLVTHHEYETLVREWGLDFRGIAGSPQQIIAQAGQVLLESGSNLIRFIGAFRKVIEPVAWQALDDMEGACRQVDAIIFSAITFPCYYLAQRLNIPAITTMLQPLTRTRTRPNILMPVQISLGREYNQFTHRLIEQLFWHPLRPTLNRWRAERGLNKTPLWGHFGQAYRQRFPQLCAFSPILYPRPADWRENIHQTGYWFLDTLPGWQPPDDLEEFLEGGSKPICVGFGSMRSQELEKRLDIILDALARSRRRAILLTGWSGVAFDNLPKWIYQAQDIPHSWLFPRVAAVIHHGGAGTTAAALKAGVPAVVMPFFFDQIFWGKRVAALGAGPAPIGRRKISVPAVVKAIDRVSNDYGMIERVESLGETIRSENGLTLAVRAVESYLQPIKGNGWNSGVLLGSA